jgi:1,4-alpha-glucan branching enzyme
MDKNHLAEQCALFLSGNDTHAHLFFGAHVENGEYIFRVFAPAADSVFLVGSFNSWQETDPMTEITDGFSR